MWLSYWKDRYRYSLCLGEDTVVEQCAASDVAECKSASVDDNKYSAEVNELQGIFLFILCFSCEQLQYYVEKYL